MEIIHYSNLLGIEINNTGIAHFWAIAFALYAMMGLFDNVEKIVVAFLSNQVNKTINELLINITTKTNYLKSGWIGDTSNFIYTIFLLPLCNNTSNFSTKYLAFLKELNRRYKWVFILMMLVCSAVLYFGFQTSILFYSWVAVIPFLIYVGLAFIPPCAYLITIRVFNYIRFKCIFGWSNTLPTNNSTEELLKTSLEAVKEVEGNLMQKLEKMHSKKKPAPSATGDQPGTAKKATPKKRAKKITPKK